jgi:hypothetical protein
MERSVTETKRPDGGSPQLAQAMRVVECGMQASAAYQRPDLTERLAAAKRTLAEPGIHVVVIGDFKQGKSSLANALLGTNLCPVDDDVATAVPTYLRYGAQPRAELLFHGDPPRREPIETPLRSAS